MRFARSAAFGAVALSLTAVPAAGRAQPQQQGAVVIVGVPALHWQDVTETGTPTLWRLAGQGAIGSLSVRAAAAVTAPADGWVTLGAGDRATGRLAHTDPLAMPALPADMSALRARNNSYSSGAQVGALGTALRTAGVKRVAFGPGAALALADDAGELDEVNGSPAASGAFRERLAGAVRDRAVVVVEAAELVAASTGAALAELDSLVDTVVNTLTPQDTLLIAGLSDRPGEPAHLRVAIARGAAYPQGGLRSALTRRDGFVQLIDLGPTVLRLKNLPASDAMAGRPWTRVSPGRSSLPADIAQLVDADRAADGYRRYVPPFFFLLVLAQVLVYGGGFLALKSARGDLGRRTRVLAATRGFALAFAAVPAATYLAHLTPWWRHPLGYLIAVVAVIDAAVYAVATRGPWRWRPLGAEGFVAGMTFAVIGVDLVTGARLQMSSLAGYSPVVAGRFAGIGNVAFAVFGTGAVLLAAALCVGATARRAVAVVAVIGSAAIVIDGSPLWGSDLGGVLALVPAFAVLALLVSRRRISWRVILAIVAAAVAVVALFALVDYARPVDAQTHLGRFFGQLLHGGARAVVRRKAMANLRLLTHSVLTLAVPLIVVFVSVVLLRPAAGLRRAFAALPSLRAGLVSVVVMGIAGFVFNDSGVAVPALTLTVAVPLALATSMLYVDAADTTHDA